MLFTLHIAFSFQKEEFLIRLIKEDEFSKNSLDGVNTPPKNSLYLTMDTGTVDSDLKFSPVLTDNGRWFIENENIDLADKFVAIHSSTNPKFFISINKGDENKTKVGLLQSGDGTGQAIHDNEIWDINGFDKKLEPVDPEVGRKNPSLIKFHKIKLKGDDKCLSYHNEMLHVEPCNLEHPDQMFRVSMYEVKTTNANNKDNDRGTSDKDNDEKNMIYNKNKGESSENEKENDSNASNRKRQGDIDQKNEIYGSVNRKRRPLNENENRNAENQDSYNNSQDQKDAKRKKEGNDNMSNMIIGNQNPGLVIKKDDGDRRIEGGNNEEDIDVKTEKRPVSFMSSKLYETLQDVVHMYHSCTTTETVHITSTFSTTKTSMVLITSTTTLELTKTISISPEKVICSAVDDIKPKNQPKSVKLDSNERESPQLKINEIEDIKPLDCVEVDTKKIKKPNTGSFKKAVNNFTRKNKPQNLFDELNNNSSESESDSDICEDMPNISKKSNDLTLDSLDSIVGTDLEIPDFLKNTSKKKRSNKKLKNKKRKSGNAICTESIKTLYTSNQSAQAPTPPAQNTMPYYYNYNQQIPSPIPIYYRLPVAQPNQQYQQPPINSISCNPVALKNC